MKFTLAKEELTNALSFAVSAISTNSTLPVMSGVLIKASEGKVIFEATDLDSSCKIVTSALVDEEGSSVLPGKIFFDIAKSLEDASVTVATDDSKATITCEQAVFATSVLNANEFPGFPHIQTNARVEIPFAKFQTMVKKVVKSTSRDDSKGIFTGILLEVKDGKVRAVASDSFRVAIAEETIEVGGDSEFEAIIPPHFLSGITSLSADDKTVCIAYNENQVLIVVDNITFINRRLQGQFPDYKRLISPSNETTIVVDKQSLIKAVKRVSVLRDENAAIVFDVDVEKEYLQLSINNSSNGAASEIIPVKASGVNCTVGFDSGYLMDGLSSVGTNDVLITLSAGRQPTHVAPCVESRENFSFDNVFETTENMLKNKFLYLVMPVVKTN